MRPNLQSPRYVILYAAVTSALFTAAVMTLHAATADIVKRNKKLRQDRAIVEIFFGQARLKELSDAEVRQFVQGCIDRSTITDPQTGRNITLLLAYATDRRKDRPRDANDLVGYGFGVSGTGFWARIDGLLAVSPDLSRIKGIYFLRHSETPGLGGRITDDAFRRQFVGRDMTPPAKGEKFIYIGGDKPLGSADAKHGRYVDAITGATGTSVSVEKFINENIIQFRRAMAASGQAGITNEDR